MTAKDATANTHTTYRVSYTTFQNLKFSYMYSEKKEVLQNITLSAGTANIYNYKPRDFLLHLV